MEEFRGAANIGRGHFRWWKWHKNGSKQNLFLFHVNHVGAILVPFSCSMLFFYKTRFLVHVILKECIFPLCITIGIKYGCVSK